MLFRHFLAALMVAITTPSFSQEIEAPFEFQLATIELAQPLKIEETIRIVAQDVQPEVSKIGLHSFLTQNQINLLTRAYEIGKNDNHKNPEILQGILMQESAAGVANYKSTKNNCFGIFQIKIAAVQEVLNNYPELALQFGVSPTNKIKLREKLTQDDEFSISVASKYLLILKRYGYNTIRELSLAYNQGAGGAKRLNPNTFGYSNSVVNHIKKLSKWKIN